MRGVDGVDGMDSVDILKGSRRISQEPQSFLLSPQHSALSPFFSALSTQHSLLAPNRRAPQNRAREQHDAGAGGQVERIS